MANIQDILKDQNFIALPRQEQIKVMARVDNNFKSLPMSEKNKVLDTLTSKKTLFREGVTELTDAKEINDDQGFTGTVAKYRRPVLQGVGVAAGEVAGIGAAPFTGGTSLVAGPVAGWTIANYLDDLAQEWSGSKETPELQDRIKDIGQYAYEGAQGEAVGLGVGSVVGKTVKPAIKGGKAVYDGVANSISKKRELANILANMEKSNNPEVVAAFNQIKQLMPDYQATMGAQRGNPDMISLERGAINTSEKFPGLEGQVRMTQDGNKQVIKDTMDDLVPGQSADLKTRAQRDVEQLDSARQSMQQTDLQQTGVVFRDAIEEAKKPIKTEMSRMRDEIPDYPMEFSATQKAVVNLRQRKDVSDEEAKAVNDFLSSFKNKTKQHGSTTKTAVGIQRTLNDLINRAEKNNSSSMGALMQIKAALQKDFDEIGRLARTGKILEHNGKVIHPDKLAQELESNLVKISQLNQKSKIDYDAVQKALKEKNYPADRFPGDSETAFQERILGDYERKIGGDIPRQSIDKKQIDELAQRNAKIQEILSQASPGQDVGAIYNAYNKYASEEYFGRFDKKSIQGASNKNTNLENVTRYFKDKTGVQELINSVGPEKAKEILRDHFRSDFGKFLSSKKQDSAIRQWFVKNRDVLREVGLQDEFNEIVKQQIGYNRLEKIAGTDVEQLFIRTLQGNRMSQRSEMASLIRKIGNDSLAKNGLRKALMEHLEKQIILPSGSFGNVRTVFDKAQGSMDVLFTPNERNALNVIRDAVEMSQSMTKGNILGNSHTQELANQARSRIIGGKKRSKVIGTLFDMLIGAGTWKVTQSPIAAVTATGSSSALRKKLADFGDEKIRKYLQKAITDPDYARRLINSVKSGKINEKTIKMISRDIARATAYSFQN